MKKLLVWLYLMVIIAFVVVALTTGPSTPITALPAIYWVVMLAFVIMLVLSWILASRSTSGKREFVPLSKLPAGTVLYTVGMTLFGITSLFFAFDHAVIQNRWDESVIFWTIVGTTILTNSGSDLLWWLRTWAARKARNEPHRPTN